MQDLNCNNMVRAPAYRAPVVPGSSLMQSHHYYSIIRARPNSETLHVNLKVSNVSNIIPNYLGKGRTHFRAQSTRNIQRSLASILPPSMSSHLRIRLSIGQAVVLLRGSQCYDLVKLARLLGATIFHTGGDRQRETRFAGRSRPWSLRCAFSFRSEVGRTYLAWPSARPARQRWTGFKIRRSRWLGVIWMTQRTS